MSAASQTNPSTPTVAVWVQQTVIYNFWHLDTLTISAEHHSARMLKITINPVWHRTYVNSQNECGAVSIEAAACSAQVNSSVNWHSQRLSCHVWLPRPSVARRCHEAPSSHSDDCSLFISEFSCYWVVESTHRRSYTPISTGHSLLSYTALPVPVIMPATLAQETCTRNLHVCRLILYQFFLIQVSCTQLSPALFQHRNCGTWHEPCNVIGWSVVLLQ